MRLRREMRGAPRPFGAAIRREEDKRIRERDALCSGRRRVRTRELHERRRPRRVVVQAGVDGGVVSVRHDDDLLARRDADFLGDEVHERRAAAVDRRREALAADVEAIGLQRAAEPRRGSSGAHRAGPPVRIVGGEVGGERRGNWPVECRRQVRRLQGGGTCHAEREEQKRQPDEEPGAAVEARVDGTLERPRPRPAALGRGRGGRHDRSV